MEQWVLNERSDLIRAVSHFGFLPFFANEIEGFSVEEMTPRKLWFTDIPGPWEWKGPVISEGNCVYGKFFDKKAGFVSNKWFPDFANLRRDGYDFDARFEDGLAGNREKYLYDLIASRHSILSKDAKILVNFIIKDSFGNSTYTDSVMLVIDKDTKHVKQVVGPDDLNLDPYTSLYAVTSES